VQNYVPKASNALMFGVYVAVVYFMFLICISVLVIVVTIVVQYTHLRSESKPFTEMPTWVNRYNFLC